MYGSVPNDGSDYGIEDGHKVPSNTTNTLAKSKKNKFLRSCRPKIALIVCCVLAVCSMLTAVLVLVVFHHDSPLSPPTVVNAKHNAETSLLKLNAKTTVASAGCESTIMIIRHCEKKHSTGHCSYVGYERANQLPSLFGNDKSKRWPLPSYLYSLTPTRSEGHYEVYREIETLQPLAKTAKLPIDSDNDAAGKKLSKKIMSGLWSGDLCGKLAVVSWKHDEMPKLAQKLGCGPNDGCPDKYSNADFDTVWQIKFVYAEKNQDYSDTQNVQLSSRRTFEQKFEWSVFGSVTKQGFDPLQTSKKAGDYPSGGIETGGRWENDDWQL